jgi:hypothetical protein
MQLIFHTGAHGTDEDRLLKSLLRNKEKLSRRGTAVPGPGKYRSLLKDTFKAMETTEPADNARDVLIDAMLDDEVADRMVLSNEHFFGSPRFALTGDILYPQAPERMVQLRHLFRFDQIEMFMAIRNPASFIPLVLKNAPAKKVQEVLEAADLMALRWSDLLTRVRAAVPDLPVTVWCNEDTPLIWGQILREIGGLEHGEPVIGGFDLLYEIMSREGVKRLRAYLTERPEISEMHKRRVIAAFLDKYAIDEAVEEELDLPGWTEDLVEAMTESYDEDVRRIQHIPGVQLICP